MLWLILFFVFLFSPFSAKANSDFNIDTNFQYQVFDNGQAKVTVSNRVTNNLSQVYINHYLFKINQKNISQITAHDSNGNIIDKIDKNGDETTISLRFDKPIIGKDQITEFFISYVVDNFAVKKGKTWEILIPKNYISSDNQRQSIILEIPISFGEPSSSIRYSSYHLIDDHHQISYQDTSNQPILLTFGNHQLFQLDLNYEISNSSSEPINTQIALPPNTYNQQVNYQSIDPLPIEITSDDDGNWLAKYRLEPNQTLNINALANVKTFPTKAIPTTYLNEHLQSQEYWPVGDFQVNNLLNNINPKNPKNIYKFVVNYLTYDFNKLNSAKREGATYAINQPQKSLCTEFSDLLVTLYRTSKIPAREIEGYSYSNDELVKPINYNSDILHAWVDYFDSTTNSWKPVDPTWENTTKGIDYFDDVDLNHITFVTHGLSSDYPSPAGSYKSTNIKTVNVAFTTSEFNPKLNSPLVSIKDSMLIIKNQNLSALNQVSITIDSQKQFISSMPPLSTSQFSLPKTFTNRHYKITTQSDSTALATTNLSNPLFLITLLIGISLIIIILSILGIIISRNIHEKNP